MRETRGRFGLAPWVWTLAACAFGALALGFCCPGPAGASDWPQWGGPQRNGTVSSALPPAGDLGLVELWRRPAPEGISALVVTGDSLLTLGMADGLPHAWAFDAGTGEARWRAPIPAFEGGQEYGTATTPATDGETLFLVSPGCHLLALQTTSGSVRWSRDLVEDFATGPMPLGCWTSPLLAGNLVVVQVNGQPDAQLVAFSKQSGEVVWKTGGLARATHSSPGLGLLGGVEQVLVLGVEKGLGALQGISLECGELLWRHDFEQPDSYSADMPLILFEGRVAAIGWNDVRAVDVTPPDGPGGRWSTELAWVSDSLNAALLPVNLHAVAVDGDLAGFDQELLVWIDGEDGRRLWSERIYAGSLIAVDGRLVILSQAAGALRIAEASSRGYGELLSDAVFTPGAPTDTPPSYAGGRLYLRNSEEIVALEIRPSASSRTPDDLKNGESKNGEPKGEGQTERNSQTERKPDGES